MGWASGAFTSELARAGIFPVGDNTGDNTGSNSSKSSDKKENKKVLCYYDYSFPTEAQVRALGFITMHTSVIFEGKTKEEARVFIKANMEYAQECANE